jgi:hypothetical protein
MHFVNNVIPFLGLTSLGQSLPAFLLSKKTQKAQRSRHKKSWNEFNTVPVAYRLPLSPI